LLHVVREGGVVNVLSPGHKRGGDWGEHPSKELLGRARTAKSPLPQTMDFLILSKSRNQYINMFVCGTTAMARAEVAERQTWAVISDAREKTKRNERK
jgi:hypothetical protein